MSITLTTTPRTHRRYRYLLVVVAPKHIHRNVTTTLQSRFTPNPHPTGHPALFADQPPPHGPPRTLRRPPPIYTVHLALLPRPVTDLGLNVSDNIRCDVINSYLLTLQIWGPLKNTYILLTSSSSFALIGHRTLELYYFILLLLFYFIFIFYYFYLFIYLFIFLFFFYFFFIFLFIFYFIKFY